MSEELKEEGGREERGACGNKGCEFFSQHVDLNCRCLPADNGEPALPGCQDWMMCIESLPKADVVSKATRKLPVELTDSQIAERAREAADLTHTRRQLEAEKKAKVDSYNETIKSLQVRADEISEEIHDGEIIQNVDCLVQKRFDAGRYLVIRLDNNTIIEDRPLNPDELQAELDMWLALEGTGELLDMAEEFIRQTQRASASHLQRKFGLGVNQAETMIIQLAECGVLGPLQEDGTREILDVKEEEQPADEDEDAGKAKFEEQVNEAIELICKNGRVSTSMIQRKMKLGYSRCAKIMDELEDRKIIGPVKDNSPREILIEVDVPEEPAGDADSEGAEQEEEPKAGA